MKSIGSVSLRYTQILILNSNQRSPRQERSTVEPRYNEPRYSEQIVPVPWYFVISRLHCKEYFLCVIYDAVFQLILITRLNCVCYLLLSTCISLLTEEQKKFNYSETPPYGHLGNTVTSLLRPLFWPPGKTAIHFIV